MPIYIHIHTRKLHQKSIRQFYSFVCVSFYSFGYNLMDFSAVTKRKKEEKYNSMKWTMNECMIFVCCLFYLRTWQLYYNRLFSTLLRQLSHIFQLPLDLQSMDRLTWLNVKQTNNSYTEINNSATSAKTQMDFSVWSLRACGMFPN